MLLSQLAETLIGSEIVKLGAEIKEKISRGEKIYNFTIGDFDPQIFPIPEALKQLIIEAYTDNFTNYPLANGNPDLRQALSDYNRQYNQLEYSPEEILVGSGGRPLIYTAFRAVCNAGDKVLYATPSWNNNHYTHFVAGTHVVIPASRQNNFMPAAADIQPHLKNAALLCLCSPQNPTGTTLKKEELEEICRLVIEENNSRPAGAKKLYLLYDQMYSQLTYGGIQHYSPVILNAGMRPYTIYIDAISKVFAATGVRVGWSLGPKEVLQKMKDIQSHIGAWAPMPEQKGVARFLYNHEAINNYLQHFKTEAYERLEKIYEGLMQLKAAGHAIDAIAPEAAIYLTISFNLTGKTTAEGKLLEQQTDVTSYLLDEAKLAIVPFSAFGDAADSPWYRLSVGTCKKKDIGNMLLQLQQALEKLK